MDPTILYIVYHQGHNAIKVGIGDIAGKRFKAHRTKGWELVCYWYFQNRRDAKRVESIVLQTLREKYGHFLNKGDMPYGGYTETFNAKKITKRRLIGLVNRAIRGS
jgi:predicted GIY-YIG superfamily endonuclease